MTELAYSTVLASIADDYGNIEAHVGTAVEHLFFDSELAVFIASIPSDVVLAGDWLRGVLREAFRDEWPLAIRTRPDKGDFEPAFAAYLEALRVSGELDRLAEMRALGDLGIVEPKRFREAFGQFENVGPGDWIRFWPALAVEAFASGLSRENTLPRGAVA